MSAQRPPSDPPPALGPLDELRPGLRAPAPTLPKAALHPRILELPEDGPVPGRDVALVTAMWEDPGGAEALHREVKRLVETALLVALSRPATQLAMGDPLPTRVLLFAFAPPPADTDRALAPFGLTPQSPDPKRWRDALAALRGEASRMGREPPDAPHAVYEARITLPDERADAILELEARMRELTGDELFGAAPGNPARRLAALLEKMSETSVDPDPQGLHRAETALGQATEETIRWIPPLLFQALCDFVGVVASRTHRRKVQWALAEPDEDDLAPPPLLRAELDDGWVHVPIGLHLLRWCVMPLRQGEDAAPLADWVADQFG